MVNLTRAVVNKQKIRSEIRSHIRKQRNALTRPQQALASKSLLSNAQRFMETYFAEEHLTENNICKYIKKIGLYLSNDGELDPSPIIEYCWSNNIDVYLPVLHPFTAGHLLFLKYTPDTQLKKNKYGISEPTLTMLSVCPITELDIVFTPLVAFDRTGQRLGMGGGYYDRTFELKTHSPRPLLVGLAHDCQQHSLLPSEAWDVPLKHIITPTHTFTF